MTASTAGLTSAEARMALAASDADIARILGERTGVAFVGSAKLDPRARHQFSRYGDVPIYIVNPKGGDADGIPVVKSVLDLPDEIDLVVVRVGPRWAADVIADCGKRGIRQALVFTDGYTETGADGAAMEAALGEAARRAGVRLIGPNTNDNAFERYPEPENHRGGKIAMVTQSGANGRSVVEGVTMGASFHRWVTTGNEVDLEVADFIHHFAGLPEVSVIALYVEGFKSAAKLRVALDRAMRAGKPVVAIKMGATEGGARAAQSHTGHLTGADAVIEGLFRQYGVIRVHDVDELLETANMLSKLPLDAGSRCAMYTISGGTAALMAEGADANGLTVPRNPPALCEEIYRHIPRNVSVANPIDNGGVFVMVSEPGVRREVIDLIASNPEVDLLIFGMNAAYGPLSDRMGEDVRAWAPTGPKPVVAVWTSVITDTQGYRDLVASGVPIFRSFGKCMRALGTRQRYIERRARYARPDMPVAELDAVSHAALAKGGVIGARDATALLTRAGIALAAEQLCATPEEAAAAADTIGYPVVLKLMSPDIPHKTEGGLVRLGIASRDAVLSEGAALMTRGRALAGDGTVDGILVQEQIPAGIEMIIGLSQDPLFGPVLTIGAGGIYAEVMKDAVSMPLPVTIGDVREMIDSLRMAPLLDGVRGAPPVDKTALIRLAMAVAELGCSAGAMIEELDLNPVVALPDRAVAVDALVIGAGRATVPRAVAAAPRRDGTIVWISGATEGIGLGLARNVPFADARVINLSRRPHPDYESVIFDLTEPASWDRVRASFRRELDGFTGRAIFIHNAFDPGAIGVVGKVPQARYDKSVIANVAAPLALGAAFIDLCPPEVDGGLVMMSSGSAVVPLEGLASYCAAKVAVEHWVEVVQRERESRGGSGPWVVAVRPGAIDTAPARVAATLDPAVYPRAGKVAASRRLDIDSAGRRIWAELPPPAGVAVIAYEVAPEGADARFGGERVKLIAEERWRHAVA